MLDNVGKYYIKNSVLSDSKEYKPYPYEKRIYEVIRIMDGKPLFLKDHYERFVNSAAILSKKLPVSFLQLKQDILKLQENEYIENNNIMIIAYFNQDISWYILYYRKSFYPPNSYYENGVETETFMLERETPNAKVLKLDYKRAVTKAIEERNVFEVILYNNLRIVTEGSKSNLFFLKDNVIYTAKDELVLKGITRKYVFKAINKLSLKHEEKDILIDDISKYDGAFLTGTSIGILPIRRIDNIEYNTSKLDVTINLINTYRHIIKNSD